MYNRAKQTVKALWKKDQVNPLGIPTTDSDFKNLDKIIDQAERRKVYLWLLPLGFGLGIMSACIYVQYFILK